MGVPDVCRQIREWQHQGLAVVPVAFNLSVAQFRRIDLVDTMEEEIRASAVDPRCLTLEITESTFMNDLAYTDLILERLKKLGMRIAIDDFGTGYSSLSYLKRLPLDILKIEFRLSGISPRIPTTRRLPASSSPWPKA